MLGDGNALHATRMRSVVRRMVDIIVRRERLVILFKLVRIEQDVKRNIQRLR